MNKREFYAKCVKESKQIITGSIYAFDFPQNPKLESILKNRAKLKAKHKKYYMSKLNINDRNTKFEFFEALGKLELFGKIKSPWPSKQKSVAMVFRFNQTKTVKVRCVYLDTEEGLFIRRTK